LKIYFLSALVTLYLMGCSSSPTPIEYYRIDSATHSPSPKVNRYKSKAIVIEQVILPSYLIQNGLVMQSGTHKIIISKQHLWAERLDIAIPKALAGKMRAMDSEYIYFLDSNDWVKDENMHLRIRIDNLHPNTQGEVIASGTFQLIDIKSGKVLSRQSFELSRSMQHDGYSESVAQIDNLLGELAIIIHQEVKTQMANHSI
jgi:uncharacterized lipoprotein YmbA